METACAVSQCVFSLSFRRLSPGVSTPCCLPQEWLSFFISLWDAQLEHSCALFFPPKNLLCKTACIFFFHFLLCDLFQFLKPQFSVWGIHSRTKPGLHPLVLLQWQHMLHIAEVSMFILVFSTAAFSDFMIYSGKEEENAWLL